MQNIQFFTCHLYLFTPILFFFHINYNLIFYLCKHLLSWCCMFKILSALPSFLSSCFIKITCFLNFIVLTIYIYLNFKFCFFNLQIIHNKKTNAKNSLTCMHCSRHFLTKSMMHQHITSVHIRARPYACQMCSYTTSTTSSLKLHLRSHTGEKPFKCEECFYSTADHNTLRKHKMRHTGQKKYTCPLCNYSSIQSTSYKKHLETKHPGLSLQIC